MRTTFTERNYARAAFAEGLAAVAAAERMAREDAAAIAAEMAEIEAAETAAMEAEAQADFAYATTMGRKWLDISTLPPLGERPGRVFVVVEGRQTHSGASWLRARQGIARTQNDGFYPADISAIEAEDHMDLGSGVVTHWMPMDLPPCPQFT